ncbi:hypothetical protein LJR027_003776 [Terrabacter sp. LjRoot27]|uniref:hypothetical protein n=1 Tax=Terrabacter sp. LjRoot27 TaxID=3342306 RepID=UPI003ECF2537
MTDGPAHDADPAAGAGWRTRVAGVAIGGVGVLLAASTAVWPTKVVAVRVPEVGDFTKGYEQLIWSWGREVVYTSDGVLLDAFSGPDPVPRLVLLVVVLALAAAGLLLRLVRAGRPGELASAVGTALALATVAGSLVQRLSVDDRTIGLQPGLVVVTTTVGWLEVVSVALLTVALAVLVVPVLLPRVADSVTGAVAGVAARLRQRHALVEATPPLVATLMDPGPVGTGRAPAVGFSDTPFPTGTGSGAPPPTDGDS